MYRVEVIHVQSGGDSRTEWRRFMYRVEVIHTCTEWR